MLGPFLDILFSSSESESDLYFFTLSGKLATSFSYYLVISVNRETDVDVDVDLWGKCFGGFLNSCTIGWGIFFILGG